MVISTKRGVIVLAALFFALCCIPELYADGGMFVRIDDSWSRADMDNQLAVITYQDGLEHLLIGITVDELHGEKAAWIFPIPASPDETAIEIVKQFPVFRGYNLNDEAQVLLLSNFMTLVSSQIYPLPLLLIGSPMGRWTASVSSFGFGDDIVTIHEHLEQDGLVTELITASDGAALSGYLASKELNLPPDMTALIDEYVGKDYCFVISWITDLQKFNEANLKQAERVSDSPYYSRFSGEVNSLSVLVTFPAKKLYFPLKLTSVYGSSTIPISLWVQGYVTPEFDPLLKPYTESEYYFSHSFDVEDAFQQLFPGKTSLDHFKYTKITLEAPSKYFQDDLWIQRSAPPRVMILDNLVSHPTLFLFLSLFLFSCLASLGAGWIIFRKEKPNLLQFFLFGLFNFLTLIGFSVAAYCMQIDRRFSTLKKSKTQNKPLRFIIGRSLIISLALMILLFFLFSFLMDVNLSDFIELFVEIIFFFFTFIFFILIFIFVMPIVWSYYKNKKITKFITLFSVLFLILTYAAYSILYWILF